MAFASMSLRTSGTARAKQARPSVAARATSGRYGAVRLPKTRERCRPTMKTCSPMRSPFDPFFNLEFNMVDPIFQGTGERPSSQRQRFGCRQTRIDVVEVCFLSDLLA
jgi:hypothetical protein